MRLIVATLPLFAACYVSVGAGVTRPIQGDVDRHVAPSYTLAAGFAWDFQRVFVGMGAGGQAAGQYATNADPTTSVAPWFIGEGRFDVTVLQRPLGDTAAYWVGRVSTALALAGCVTIVGAPSLSAGCEDGDGYTAFRLWTAATAGMAAGGKANMTLSLGPLYWQGGQALTGPVKGVGLEARLTYHFSRLKGASTFFKAKKCSGFYKPGTCFL